MNRSEFLGCVVFMAVFSLSLAKVAVEDVALRQRLFSPWN
jgi:hypothetical protein